ncbi:MAG: hypothetical protein HZB62_04255 [Nitrospirae bacterium]|nr:hypothetical protein [Nitrospirota bacterium]
MQDNLPGELKACIDMETLCCRIYKKYATLFPETAVFWEDLAREEEQHISVLIIARGFFRDGKVAADLKASLLPDMKEALFLAATIYSRITEGPVTIREALSAALHLEETVLESFLTKTLPATSDSPLLMSLQKLVSETRSHADRVREMIYRLS